MGIQVGQRLGPDAAKEAAWHQSLSPTHLRLAVAI